MILPTMNETERIYEVFRMTNVLCDIYSECEPMLVEKFRKATRFPYFQRIAYKDDKGNDWTLLAYMTSKDSKRKGIYRRLAYITYDIPRKRVEDDVNAGRGCIAIDPFAMQRTVKHQNQRGAVTEIVPHAFNRYTQRYLKPLGKENIEFGYKLESILSRYLWFDVCADMYGDKNAEKHKEDNICPYDMILKGGGLLRGQFVNNLLLRFTTYIGKDQMFENQRVQYDRMMKEYWTSNRRKI